MVPSSRLKYYPDCFAKVSKTPETFLIIFNSKISFLEKLGLDYFFSLKFDHSIASLEPHKFIKEILINQLKIKNLIVGFNFKF